MKEITITCTWESNCTVTVPDDFEVPNKLDEFPEEVLEQLTTNGATLVDWTD